MRRILWAMVAVTACAAGVSAQSRVQVGLTFTGTVKAESHTKAGVPDADGAVGPDHVVEFINGDFKVYDKTGKLLVAKTSREFWEPALGDKYGPSPDNKDPRMIYDPQAKRWYASAQRPTAGNPSLTFARSDTPDPTKGWQGVAIPGLLDPAPTGNIDFDRLGFNADGILLTVNQMVIRDGRPYPEGVAVMSIKKSDFLKAPPVLTLDRWDHYKDGRDIVPVVDRDGKSRTATFWANAPGKMTTNDLVVRIDVTTDVNPWVLTPKTTEIGDKPGQLLARTMYMPIAVNQAGGHPIFTLTRSPSAVQLVNGEFWTVQTVPHPSDSKRTALRWWRIRTADNTVLGDGFVTDPALTLTHPSLALDARGDVVIACVGFGPSQPLSVYATSAKATADAVVFDPGLTLVKAGLGENAGGGRWGDYTTTVPDPTAAGTFWTFAPYAQANGDWATVIARLTVPAGR